MMRKPTMVLIAAAVLIAALTVLAGAQDQPKQMPKISKEMMAKMMADDGAPKVGDVAPLFKLDLRFNDWDDEKSIDLNEQVGKQPILLIFGSYT